MTNFQNPFGAFTKARQRAKTQDPNQSASPSLRDSIQNSFQPAPAAPDPVMQGQQAGFKNLSQFLAKSKSPAPVTNANPGTMTAQSIGGGPIPVQTPALPTPDLSIPATQTVPKFPLPVTVPDGAPGTLPNGTTNPVPFKPVPNPIDLTGIPNPNINPDPMAGKPAVQTVQALPNGGPDVLTYTPAPDLQKVTVTSPAEANLGVQKDPVAITPWVAPESYYATAPSGKPGPETKPAVQVATPPIVPDAAAPAPTVPGSDLPALKAQDPLTKSGAMYQDYVQNVLGGGKSGQVQSAQGAADRNSALRTEEAKNRSYEQALASGAKPGTAEFSAIFDKAMQSVNSANLQDQNNVNQLSNQTVQTALGYANNLENQAVQNATAERNATLGRQDLAYERQVAQTAVQANDWQWLINNVGDDNVKAYIATQKAAGTSIAQVAANIWTTDSTGRTVYNPNIAALSLGQQQAKDTIDYLVNTGMTAAQAQEYLQNASAAQVKSVNDQAATSKLLTASFSTTDAARNASPEAWQALVMDPSYATTMAKLEAAGVVKNVNSQMPGLDSNETQAWIRANVGQGNVVDVQGLPSVVFPSTQQPIINYNGQLIKVSYIKLPTEYHGAAIFGTDLKTGLQVNNLGG